MSYDSDSDREIEDFSDITDSQLIGKVAEWDRERTEFEANWGWESQDSEAEASFGTNKHLDSQKYDQVCANPVTFADSEEPLVESHNNYQYQISGYGQPVDSPPEDFDFDALEQLSQQNFDPTNGKASYSRVMDEPEVEFACPTEEYPNCCQFHMAEFEKAK